MANLENARRSVEDHRSNAMTPDELIDLNERIGIIWDGAPSTAPITWAEAERIARAQQHEGDRLPLGKGQG